MLKQIKASWVDYFHALNLYDYFAFGWAFLLLCLLLIISIIINKTKPKLASILIVITFLLMLVLPIYIKILLDNSVRKVVIVDENDTKLKFSKSLIITGNIKNYGKIPLKRCYVHTRVTKKLKNRYLNLLYYFKPLRQTTLVKDVNLSMGEKAPFKVVYENFKYNKQYNIKIKAECY